MTDLQDRLVSAIHEVASHVDHLPPNWDEWGYMDRSQREEVSSNYPQAYYLTGLIDEVKNDSRSVHNEILAELIADWALREQSGENIRSHPLWDTAFALATHPNITDSAKREFLDICDAQGVFLEVYRFEYLLIERPEDGDAYYAYIEVPASGLMNAEERAEQWMDDNLDRLASQFGLVQPYFHDRLDYERQNGWRESLPLNASVKLVDYMQE